jgi:pilus assembly protein CpaF
MKIADRLGRTGSRRREPEPSTPQERPEPRGKEQKSSETSAAGSNRIGGISDALFKELYGAVVDRLDTRGVLKLEQSELMERVDELIGLVSSAREIVITGRQRQKLVKAITDEIVGLGPLESLLADESVSDILVNAHDQIYVERGGLLQEVETRFRDDEHLLNTINRIVSRIGRRIDEASPMVDARLPDGSRVNAIIPPLAIDGPVLSIRRFGTGPVSLRALVEKGALTSAMAHYLRSAVRSQCNVLIAGGTGAGKTTMLNALSRFISSRERIVTIEDSAELQLQQRHVVRLETRPANIEGKGQVSIRDLVRNALRMRPDRIIVGEVRAEEVLDMIQAMNTGHEGSMTTVHANSVEDGFTRLMSMLSMAGTKLSEAMMAQMVGRAIDVILHLNRGLDGQRRVGAIAEVDRVHGSEFELNMVYQFAVEGKQGDKIIGKWNSSRKSNLLDRFNAHGVPLDPRCLQ